MKKSVYALFFALLCTSVLLTACKQEPKTEAESTAEPEQLMQLAKDKQTEFQIVSYLEDEAVVKDFAMDLFIRTSAKFELVHDGSQGEHTIYIGSPEDFRGKDNVGSSITYTNYEISISDGNIYVCLGLETMAEEVLSMLKNSIQKNEDGSCTLPQSLHISGDACQISQIVPTFVTGSGALRDLHDVGNGNYQASYENIDEAAALREIEVYRQTLADDGYTLWQENEIEGSCFLTYYKDDTLVHLNYFMPLNEIRIVYGPKTYLPDAQEKESYEKMVEPSVSIIQGTENVLCMVIQTADGQFYIIDGGWDNVKLQSLTLNAGQSNEYSVSYTRDSKKDMEVLYQFLLEKAPAGELPQVNWMITHADPDHILLPTRFIKDYAGKIDLKTIIYNVPNLYNIGLGESAGSTNDPAIMTSYIDGFLNNAQQYYPDALLFYPDGRKGCGGHGQFRPGERFENFRKTRFLMPQIESRKGIDLLPEMLKEYGDYISAIIIGPYDMSVMLGTPKVITSDIMMSAIQEVFDICNAHGKSCGIFCDNEVLAVKYRNMGCNVLWTATDKDFFMRGYREEMDVLATIR